MPSLQEIQNDIRKATHNGRGSTPMDNLSTILEKTAILSKELNRQEVKSPDSAEMQKMEEAMGDVIVSIGAIATHTGANIERGVVTSLRKMSIRTPPAQTLKEALAYTLGEKHFVFDSPTNWLEQLQLEYPNMPLHVDKYILVSEKFVSWLEEGKKKTFVRFEPNQIAIPEQETLTLFDSGSAPPLELGKIKLKGFMVKPFREMNEEDAQNQGYNSKLEFVQSMKNMYEKKGLTDDGMITIYHVEGYEPMHGKKE